ncbi:MAG: hypothetical protein WCH75_07340, partial [Candidatus Binatia bacterium]
MSARWNSRRRGPLHAAPEQTASNPTCSRVSSPRRKCQEAALALTHRPHLVPATREPLSVLSVDRVISDLRRGRFVVIRGSGGVATLMLAAEAVTTNSVAELAAVSRSQPALVITARRAAVLGLTPGGLRVVNLA